MRLFVGACYSDMPPQKALKMSVYDRLDVRDTGHGFTIELLLKAHHLGLEIQEVPVRWRRRAGGESKVSGTIRGSVRAGVKILTTIGLHTWRLRKAKAGRSQKV